VNRMLDDFGQDTQHIFIIFEYGLDGSSILGSGNR